MSGLTPEACSFVLNTFIAELLPTFPDLRDFYGEIFFLPGDFIGDFENDFLLRIDRYDAGTCYCLS